MKRNIMLKKIIDFAKNKKLKCTPDNENLLNIPVFIISYNRLNDLKKLIEWLEKVNLKNIIIIDNNSTYPPLLEYYDSLSYRIVRLEENLGHLALYKCGLFDDIINSQYYILTDPDIIPLDECPNDFIETFYSFLKYHDEYTKVGFSLKIDDIPDYYESKEIVLAWEKQFQQKEDLFFYKKVRMYDAFIDTTFALYKPGVRPDDKRWWESARSDYPYQARHGSWYMDSQNPTDEDIFYKETIQKNVANWSVVNTKPELNLPYSSKPPRKFTIFGVARISSNNGRKRILYIMGCPVLTVKLKATRNTLKLLNLKLR